MGKHRGGSSQGNGEEIRKLLGEMNEAANEPQDPKTCRHRSIMVLLGIKYCNDCMKNMGPDRRDYA